MNHFIATNWYRLMIGMSMLILSLSFLFHVLEHKVANAGSPDSKMYQQRQQDLWIVATGNKFYQITWDNVFKRYECEEICK